MTFLVFLICVIIVIFIVLYRNNSNTNTVYKFVNKKLGFVYDKYAPYSFKVIRQKVKDLGQEYTPRQYMIQIAVFSIGAAVITYLYFYNIVISLVYACAAVLVIPYLTYMRCKRLYSEFIFEQIQTYTTNTIMEFRTTQSFVKALEGVYNSNVLEDPVKSDVKMMIDMAYENGTIEASINYMNSKYNYYIMVMLVQFMLGIETYNEMLENWWVKLLLHGIILLNTFFILSGVKYYNEDVGAE